MTHKLFSSAFTRRTLLATGASFGICWLGDSLLRGSTAYAVTAETQSLSGGTAPDRSPAVASDLSSLDTASTLSAFDVDRGNPNYREYQLMQQAIIDEQAARDAGVFSDSLLNPIRPLAVIDALPRDGAISRFAAFSDTHMGYWGELGRNKTWHALETYQALAPDLDAMFLIGDVCTKNTWEEVNHFRDGIVAPLPTLFSSRPPLYLLMGNHDFIDWSIAGFEHHYGRALRAYMDPSWSASDDTPMSRDYGQQQNIVVKVGETTVIKLCGNDQVDWDYQPCYDFLAAALEQAAFEKPGHPIFVMAHHPVPGLMISDADDAGYYGEGTSRDLIALMAQYPQVIFMAGHTHNPLQIPTSIDTDLGFTAICTAMTGASLWYAWEELEETRTNTSQGLLVDVFADGSVRMYRIDLMTGNLMPHVWNISANTVALEEFSTIRRRLATDGPEFPADSMITFENQQDQVLATWPQATRYSDEQAEDFTFNYRYTAWGMKSGLSYGADDFMSDFYKSSLADTVTRSVAIDASDPCAINLQAINPYGVASTPLTTETPFDVLSLSGVDRFQTSAMISARSYESAQDIIIATGAEFADALTASGLAGLLDAPVLLTAPSSLPNVIAAEIKRLKVTRAHIVGGSVAVGDGVVQGLSDIGVTIAGRYSGGNRFATARDIYLNNSGWGSLAIIASGANFADACSVAPIAFSEKAPLFLVDASGMLDNDSKALIASAGFATLLIIGGTVAVSEEVEEWANGLGYSQVVTGGADNEDFGEVGAAAVSDAPSPMANPLTVARNATPPAVVRIAGSDRYQTSAALANWAIGNLGYTREGMAVATGSNFPDALCGGYMQGKRKSVLLLSDTGHEDSCATVTDSAADNLQTLVYLGGESALDRKTRVAITDALPG